MASAKALSSMVLALGSPARVIRELSEDDISNVRNYAERYIDNMRRYRNGALKLL